MLPVVQDVKRPEDKIVFQKVVPESPRLDRVVSKSWSGAPKGCPRIPTARRGGVPKVGVVFQKVVPESPLCILLDPRSLQTKIPKE